ARPRRIQIWKSSTRPKADPRCLGPPPGVRVDRTLVPHLQDDRLFRRDPILSPAGHLAVPAGIVRAVLPHFLPRVCLGPDPALPGLRERSAPALEADDRPPVAG